VKGKETDQRESRALGSRALGTARPITLFVCSVLSLALGLFLLAARSILSLFFIAAAVVAMFGTAFSALGKAGLASQASQEVRQAQPASQDHQVVTRVPALETKGEST
jgi:hypothetical protein